MQAGFMEGGKVFLIFTVDTFAQNTLDYEALSTSETLGLIALKQIHLD